MSLPLVRRSYYELFVVDLDAISFTYFPLLFSAAAKGKLALRITLHPLLTYKDIVCSNILSLCMYFQNYFLVQNICHFQIIGWIIGRTVSNSWSWHVSRDQKVAPFVLCWPIRDEYSNFAGATPRKWGQSFVYTMIALTFFANFTVAKDEKYFSNYYWTAITKDKRNFTHLYLIHPIF